MYVVCPSVGVERATHWDMPEDVKLADPEPGQPSASLLLQFADEVFQVLLSELEVSNPELTNRLAAVFWRHTHVLFRHSK